MRHLQGLSALFRRRRRVLTYDDLDGVGVLPGSADSRSGADRFTHNGSLDQARMNGYFGH